ncbi:hypothetical protein ACR3K2_10790 [Cryptosporidium serpentis]
MVSTLNQNDLTEFMEVLETRLSTCEKLINIKERDTGTNTLELQESSDKNKGANNILQSRITIGQSTAVANLEHDIYQLRTVISQDEKIPLNEKLDFIEGIIRKVYSLGPLEEWESYYDSIKAYIETDSTDFEATLLTLDARKAYIMEHYYEFELLRRQMKDLNDLLPFVNYEIDESNFNELLKKIDNLEIKGRKLGYEAQQLWEDIQNISFLYSNFILKYNIYVAQNK